MDRRTFLGAATATPLVSSAALRPSPAAAETEYALALAGADGAAVFASRSEVASAKIGGAHGRPGFLVAAGYRAAGDGGAALYRRAEAEPRHPGKVQSADGSWWEIAERELNVRMFGAIGDGEADDRAAIEDAIAALPAQGGILRIPQGTYRVTEGEAKNTAIHVARDNVRILGDGVGITVVELAEGAESHVFHFDTARNLSIEHLTIDGNASGQTLGVHGILFRNVDDLRIVDIEVRNTRAYGIGGQNGENDRIFIERIWGHDTGFNVIDIKNKNNANDSIIIAGVAAERWGLNTSQSAKAAVTVRGRATISNVHCRDFGGPETSATTGVRLREGAASQANGIGGHHSTVANVVVEGNSRHGTIGVEVLARHCSVSAVSVSGVAEGVVVAQEGNTLSAISVHGCDTGLNFKDLDSMPSLPSYCTLVGFTATGCGVGLRTGSSRNAISGFTITRSTERGIDIEEGADFNVFEAGAMADNAAHVLDHGRGTRIDGVAGLATSCMLLSPDVPLGEEGATVTKLEHGLAFPPRPLNFTISPVLASADVDADFSYAVVAADETHVEIATRVRKASSAPGASVSYAVHGAVLTGNPS